MELDLDLANDAHMELYCDVLMLYLLVGSALGPCELERRLGQALDSGKAEQLIAARRHFDALSGEMKARILEGDPTLPALLESRRDDAEPAPLHATRPASA